MSYIEKEPLLVKLKSLKKYWGSTLTAQGIGKAIDEVEKAEEVNISETGKDATPPISYWVETEVVTTSKNGREKRSKKYTCANCNASNGDKISNYCADCGADMRGADNGQPKKTG